MPLAMAALLAILKDTAALSGVTVLDGQQVTEDPFDEAVVVGFIGPEDPTAVEGQLAIEGMSVSPNRDLFTIRCVAIVSSGEADITAVRARVFELFGAVGQVLVNNHTLGGAVGTARISDYRLSLPQTKAGAGAVVLFGVTCDAYTRS